MNLDKINAVKIYQVGGSIRDEYLGIKSKDLDYSVEADSYETMKDWILIRGGKIFLESPQYFTIRAIVPTMGAADFVLCRKDGAYYDGRRPESVTVGDIYDDLARRDFAMNAIARDIHTGETIDPFGGVEDIKVGVIRCVGLANDRFTEDYLRLLRAIRFAITKKFALSYDIEKCLRDKVIVSGLFQVSKERIREELYKCFKFSTYETLQMLHKFSLVEEAVFTTTDLWLKPTNEQ